MRIRFAELIATLPPRSRVLELGSGLGLLAECVLDRCTNLCQLDGARLLGTHAQSEPRSMKRFPVAQFINANINAPDWTNALNPPYVAVIAMQAVREIRHKPHTLGLYQQLRQVLSFGGMVAVCDGTPRDSLRAAR